MVIQEILVSAADTLKAHDNENAVLEANMIVRHYLKLEPIDVLLSKDKEVGKEDIQAINDAVARRVLHEPLQYILGVQEFMGLEFNVNRNVLVPRADTETLVEHIIDKFMNKGFSGLDIGTGSGCIAISLAHYNKRAFMRGIDISEKAIETAVSNAEKNNVSDRVEFCCADIFENNMYGKYNLIVSNPPYIETEVIKELDKDVKDYEPIGALDGGKDGLDFYRYIIEISPMLLFEDGILAFEVGHNQAKQVSLLMEKDFIDIEIVKDLCGVERVVCGKIKNMKY